MSRSATVIIALVLVASSETALSVRPDAAHATASAADGSSLRAVSAGSSELISRAVDGDSGNGASQSGATSRRGRYTVFSSSATDLIKGGSRGGIFIRAENSGNVELVSRGLADEPPNGPTRDPVISGNGRFVVYSSNASNLVSGDTNGYEDIFRYDRKTGLTALVSLASDGAMATGESRAPAVSTNGRWVAYQSDAQNLVAGDENGAWDVFLTDVSSGETQLVSRDPSGSPGDGASEDPSISTDGRHVTFASYATDLLPGDTNDEQDVFSFNRRKRETYRVSRAADGGPTNGDSSEPSTSSNGRYTAYVSVASNIVAGRQNEWDDVYLYDRVSGVTRLVSHAPDGSPGEYPSYHPTISGEGDKVAFYSMGANLLPGVGPGQIYCYDGSSEALSLVSRSPGGEPGDSPSPFRPFVSPDGRFIVYTSLATNIVILDTNGESDVFRYRVPST